MKTLAIISAAIVLLGMSVVMTASGSTTLKPVADPGIYTGTAYASTVAFFVSGNGRSLLNITIPITSLACAPGGFGTSDTTFVIAKVPIRPNGSFSAKGSQIGVVSGFVAKFSYIFAGRFQRATKVHTGTAAGTFRENITYTDKAGAHQSCTTNNKSWTATRSGPKLKSLVTSGNYTGTTRYGSLTFATAPGRLNTITISITSMSCSPAGFGASDQTFAIPQTAVRQDGSFAAKASNTGTFQGVSATFTYWFSGNFQGLSSSNVGNAAGTFREDIVFKDAQGVRQTCTTNTQPWVAARSS